MGNKIKAKTYKNILWGIGLWMSYLTVNIPVFQGLLPGFGGEYQPILFIIISLFALIIKGSIKRDVLDSFLIIMMSLLIVAFWHFTRGNLDLISLIRCIIGLLFVVCAPALIEYIPIKAFESLVIFHLMFGMLGLMSPDIAAGIISSMGLRGSTYYQGWNAFFSSEVSYAALNFSSIIAIIIIKNKIEKNTNENFTSLSSAMIVLIMTKSVTGVILAFIVLSSLVFENIKKIKLSVLYYSLLVIIVFLIVNALFFGDKNESNRLGDAISAVLMVIKEGSIVPFFLLEASGAWRLLTNLAGLLVILDYPMGTGSLALHKIILDVIPLPLVNFVKSSLEFGLEGQEFYANVVLANYAIFGGILPTIALLIVFYRVIIKIIKINFAFKIFIIGYLFIGLIWQGALTAPGWWLLIGYIISIRNAEYKLS